MAFVAKKLYYKIGEVCEIVGVPAHVLRYWETEFSTLTPPKSRGGQRTYRPADIELLLRIRKLLYDEGFTIAGARKKLGARKRSAAQDPAQPVPGREGAEIQQVQADEPLGKVRRELENILTLLDRG
jgi:DNA-binding transcriptional MerR regulator